MTTTHVKRVEGGATNTFAIESDDVETDLAVLTRSDNGDIRVGAVGDGHLCSGDLAAGDGCVCAGGSVLTGLFGKREGSDGRSLGELREPHVLLGVRAEANDRFGRDIDARAEGNRSQ